eukprot:5125840-Amphidinium_carterae.1
MTEDGASNTETMHAAGAVEEEEPPLELQVVASCSHNNPMPFRCCIINSEDITCLVPSVSGQLQLRMLCNGLGKPSFGNMCMQRLVLMLALELNTCTSAKVQHIVNIKSRSSEDSVDSYWE